MRTSDSPQVRHQSAHPSLRWVTLADGMAVAHRLLPGVEVARCATVGPFTRAGNDKELCRVCYPRQEKTTNRFRRGRR